MQTAYLVVPFERIGSRVGARQAMIFDAASKAQLFAKALAMQVPGVAVLERELNEETGDSTETLVASHGLVPPRFPDSQHWSLALI